VLNGSSASKAITGLAASNSANSLRRYAGGSRPLARAIETMLYGGTGFRAFQVVSK
jgi:hypothetical protein